MRKMAILSLCLSFFFVSPVGFIASANAETENKCLQFQGNSYAQAPSKLIPLDKDFTVEMWVYSSPNNSGRFGEFISQGTQPYAFYMGVDPNGFLRMGDIWMDTGVRLPTNTWSHVALTHTSNDLLLLYVNGENVARKSAGRSSYNIGGTATRLGAVYWPSNVSEFFTGCLDEVRIWKTVRTPAEISDFKDSFGISNSSAGLIASYSFDTMVGFYNSIKKIYPDTVRNLGNDGAAGEYLAFSVVGNPLSTPYRGNVLSQSSISGCINGSSVSSMGTSQLIPKIKKVNARNIRQTSIDLELNGLQNGTCVGVDTFVRGTTEPISSTVGIVSSNGAPGGTPRFRMNLDTSAFECSSGRNNKLEVRTWWKFGVQASSYSSPIQIPDCFGILPNNASALVRDQSSISLVGTPGNPSPWASQVRSRLLTSQLLPAASRTNDLVTETVQDTNGCHAAVKTFDLQKIQDGNWVEVGNFDKLVDAKNCDSVHPFQPIKKVTLPDSTVLRWKVSDGKTWEMYSTPFIYIVGADGTKISSGSNNSDNIDIKKLETPTGLSVSLVKNEVVIKVFLPPTSRSKVKEVNLVSATLGYPAQRALGGIIEGANGVFRIPTSKLVGKSGKHTLKIDSRGEGVATSRELVEVVDLSKFTASQKITETKVTPKPKISPKPQKVTCFKGALTRTFDGNTCPPGYKLKK